MNAIGRSDSDAAVRVQWPTTAVIAAGTRDASNCRVDRPALALEWGPVGYAAVQSFDLQSLMRVPFEPVVYEKKTRSFRSCIALVGRSSAKPSRAPFVNFLNHGSYGLDVFDSLLVGPVTSRSNALTTVKSAVSAPGS